MFVDKGGQGCVILFVESIRFINQFRSKEICSHFLFISLMVFMNSNSSISLGSKGYEI